MKARLILLTAVLLLAIPGNMATLSSGTYNGQYEPFLDGYPPSQDWYTFNSGGNDAVLGVSAGRFLFSGATGGSDARFLLQNVSTGGWSLYVTLGQTLGDCDETGDGSYDAAIGMKAGATNLFLWTVRNGCDTNPSSSKISNTNMVAQTLCDVTEARFVGYNFTWDTTVDRFYVNGCELQPNSPVTWDVASSIWAKGVAVDADNQAFYQDLVWFDQTLGLTFTIGETNVPTEFDTGLLAFITSMGFITPASQFFFSLILVGIATVSGGVASKFMAPSRMKLVIVLSVAALVGAFCAILQLVDLWMFLLAIVIGGTVVKGSQEFRNTWREIRETIAQRSRLVDESGQEVQPAPGLPEASPADSEAV